MPDVLNQQKTDAERAMRCNKYLHINIYSWNYQRLNHRQDIKSPRHATRWTKVIIKTYVDFNQPWLSCYYT